MGIELPSNFSTDIASGTTSTLAGLSSYTTLVISVLLAVTVITILIRVLTHRG